MEPKNVSRKMRVALLDLADKLWQREHPDQPDLADKPEAELDFSSAVRLINSYKHAEIKSRIALGMVSWALYHYFYSGSAEAMDVLKDNYESVRCFDVKKVEEAGDAIQKADHLIAVLKKNVQDVEWPELKTLMDGIEGIGSIGTTGRPKGKNKLEPEQIAEIKKLARDHHWTVAQLASKFEVSRQTIYNYLKE